MQKKCKILLIGFFVIFTIPVLVATIIIWYVDPFRLYHEPFMCKNQIYDDMRYNAKGLIDYTDFDSLILGSSMLSNTSSKEAGDLLGGKFLNLSMWGSDFEDRAVIMDYALRNKNIKKIIFSLDRGYMLQTYMPTQVPSDKFYFLYNKFRIDSFKIYLNNRLLKKIFSFKCESFQPDIDMPSSWYNENDAKLFGLNGWKREYVPKFMEEMERFLSNKTEKKNIDPIILEEKKIYIEKNILNYAKKYPQTDFILLIPPYFVAQNIINDKYSSFSFQNKLIKYILDQNLKNIKIYGFDDRNFVLDIENYRDMIHYLPTINSEITKSISKNIGEINKENIDTWQAKCEEMANNFDIMKLYNYFLDIKLK